MKMSQFCVRKSLKYAWKTTQLVFAAVYLGRGKILREYGNYTLWKKNECEYQGNDTI